MVTGGAQRARRVDQCVAGAVVQTRGLEQFTGLDRGGEGCQLRAPVAMNERLRQEQIGALDTPGAAKGLIGQCLGIVVRASLDERTDQIGGGFTHHPDCTEVGLGRKSAGPHPRGAGATPPTLRPRLLGVRRCQRLLQMGDGPLHRVLAGSLVPRGRCGQVEAVAHAVVLMQLEQG